MRLNKTESEQFFEAFCQRNRFESRPVPVERGKTPDYTLTIGGTLIVVEVKQVEPTADELESERLAVERGYGNVISTTPGKVVRNKIADCAPQIRARTQGKHPGLLVLWERGHCAGRHTEPYHITVAMEGFEQVVLTVPPIGSGESPSVVGMKHGGSRKMTPGRIRRSARWRCCARPNQTRCCYRSFTIGTLPCRSIPRS